MKIHEALKEVYDGKKVRMVTWEPEVFMYFCKKRKAFIDWEGDPCFSIINIDLEVEWEVYEEEDEITNIKQKINDLQKQNDELKLRLQNISELFAY